MTRPARSVFIRFGLFIGGLIAGTAFAAPQLLLPVAPSALPSAALNTPAPSRSQAFRVQFNKEGARGMKVGDEADLPMPNGMRYGVVFDQLVDHGGEITSWIGYLKDSIDRKRVVITTGPGGSFGRIATPEGDFRMSPGPGHDWLVDMRAEQQYLDPIDLREDARFPPPMPKRSQVVVSSPDYFQAIPGVNAPLTAKSHQTNVFVDLMIVYSNGLATQLGSNLMTRINNWVTATNVAYVDSHVHITLRLVHTVAVDYADGNSSSTALTAISPFNPSNGAPLVPAAPFSNIETLRNTYGADMVAFWRGGQEYGGNGVAWVATAPITPANASTFAPIMYSVTTGCVLGCDSVMQHELGHNMGNMHDRSTVAWQQGGVAAGSIEQGSTAYSYGYAYCASGLLSCNPNVPPGTPGTPPACAANQQPECSTGNWCLANVGPNFNNFTDIMAYFQCSAWNEPTKFSNPDITCTGPTGPALACGIAAGNSNAADAARSMNENAAGLSAMKSSALATASISLGSSVNPSASGQSVTFSATVSGGSGTPTGTVNFRDNGVTISGCGAAALNGMGVATCATSSLSIGSHPITAVYSGSGTYNTVTSSTLPQVVNGATPTVNLATSQNPSIVGSAVTFTASVSGASGTPTGTVNFLNGASSISGCSAVALSTGSAACSTSSLTLGTHSISAAYSGNSTYNARTSSPLSQTVANLATPSITLGSTANPSTVGQYVTYTAVVSGSSGTPTGTIVFRDNGTIINGCGGLVMANGRASCTIGNQALGTHSMTAVYSGNGTYSGITSSTLPQVVNVAKANTPSITLGSSVNPSTVGQYVELTAVVFGAAGTPTGTLVFRDNGNVISGCGGLAMTNGRATCTPGSLTLGSHAITVVYSGNSTYNGVTSSTLPQTVGAAKANTPSFTLGSSQNPSVAGNVVTFTAVLTGPAGTPTGNVVFRNNGQMISGCGGLALVGGQVTCSPMLNSVGVNSITGIYLGDSNYNGITSSVVPQNVQ